GVSGRVRRAVRGRGSRRLPVAQEAGGHGGDADDTARPGLPAQGRRVKRLRRAVSLRRYLLLGILAPVGLFVLINAVSLYRQTLTAVNTAYDRTLLASAKSIGELLDVRGYDNDAELRVTVPYAALEAFEADNQSRMFYRVSTLRGEMVSGFGELPFWRGTLPDRNAYAALVDFYDDSFRGEPVRVAVMLQPVPMRNGG